MAKNFTIVKGIDPNSGQPIDANFTAEELSVFESLCDVMPTIGMIYNGQRQVLRVFCTRGILPNEASYKLSYWDYPPKILYLDVTTNKQMSVTVPEFVKWLGHEWTAEEAGEKPEDKIQRETLEARGKNILEAQKPENKFDATKAAKEKPKTKAHFVPIKKRNKRQLMK